MLYFLVFFIIIADQLIKFFIENNLFYGESIAIIENIFHITYVKNTGAAFGVLKGRTNIFIFITIVMLVGLLVYRYLHFKENIYINIAFGFIIGGALGNLIDRIRLNYVIDFLDFRIWPVFNLADSAVVIGAGILIIYILFSDLEC